MSTQTIGPFRHVDTVGRVGPRGFEPFFPRHRRHEVVNVDIRDHAPSRSAKPAPKRKARHLDAAAVARVAAAEVDRVLTPVVGKIIGKLDAMGKQLDRAKAHRDAIREAERTATPPAGYVRDAASGDIRPRITRDLALAANAIYGRDANGKRPGEPGYNFDGVAMLKAGASWNDINAAFWGRKA